MTRVISDVKKPNGLAISPDGKTLYVAESNGDAKLERKLLAYPLKEDGSVGARKELHDFGKERGIDGMTVTKDGVIVATAGAKDAAGIYFFEPEREEARVPEDARRPEQLLLRRRGQEDAVHHGREVAVSREAERGGEVIFVGCMRSEPSSADRTRPHMVRLRRDAPLDAPYAKENAFAISTIAHTMQPVPPASSAGVSFSAQAGPAMSRWTHFALPTNCSRNFAAVIAPPQRRRRCCACRRRRS